LPFVDDSPVKGVRAGVDRTTIDKVIGGARQSL
jgi:hypothetical protein